jgi:hypothetical protein
MVSQIESSAAVAASHWQQHTVLNACHKIDTVKKNST